MLYKHFIYSALTRLLPQTCQMMLFSTTYDDDVKTFAEKIIRNNPVPLLYADFPKLSTLYYFLKLFIIFFFRSPYIPKDLGSLKQHLVVCETNKDKYHFIVRLRHLIDLGRVVIFCPVSTLNCKLPITKVLSPFQRYISFDRVTKLLLGLPKK